MLGRKCIIISNKFFTAPWLVKSYRFMSVVSQLHVRLHTAVADLWCHLLLFVPAAPPNIIKNIYNTVLVLWVYTYSYNSVELFSQSVLVDKQNFDECCIFNPTFIGSKEPSSFWSVQLFSAFHWSSSIGKPHLTPIFFVKTTE